MIPSIQKILYTTDLSPNARYAFSYAASVANRFNARITILYVMEEISQQTAVQIVDYLGKEKWEEVKKKNRDQVTDTIRQRIEKFCEEASSELAECPFMVEDIRIRHGHPVWEILQEAESGDYDAVVMGTRGHGALTGALLGSTARRVVRRCKKPVLVVRLPEETEK